jgi:hypothetical protein
MPSIRNGIADLPPVCSRLVEPENDLSARFKGVVGVNHEKTVEGQRQASSILFLSHGSWDPIVSNKVVIVHGLRRWYEQRGASGKKASG